MSIISNYVMAILGVVLMFVVIELILPSGKNTKYIRSILGIFLVFVIITPLAKLKDLDFSAVLGENQHYELNYEYLYKVHLENAEKLKKNINTKLNENGVSGAEIVVSIEKESAVFEVKQIFVDLSRAVISQNQEHIINYTTIKAIVSECAKVEQNKVVIDG